MDKTDLQILKILQKKARIPNVEVARTVGMAPSAVLERIKKLEARGVIQGYEVRLNPEMFRSTMVVFAHIRVKDPSRIWETGKALSAIGQIQEVHYIAGDDCLVAKLRVSGNQELEQIIKTQITGAGQLESIKTHIVLSSFKESAKIVLPESI